MGNGTVVWHPDSAFCNEILYEKAGFGPDNYHIQQQKHQTEEKILIYFDEIANELNDQSRSYVAAITCNNYLSTQVPQQVQDFYFDLQENFTIISGPYSTPKCHPRINNTTAPVTLCSNGNTTKGYGILTICSKLVQQTKNA